MAKRECKVTRQEFAELAKMVRVDINEHETLYGEPQDFKTGSLGWFVNGKVTLHLKDGRKVDCQVGMNITVIGSKELPRTEPVTVASVAAEPAPMPSGLGAVSA